MMLDDVNDYDFGLSNMPMNAMNAMEAIAAMAIGKRILFFLYF